MTIKETSDELVWQLLAQLPAGEWLMTHDRTNVMQVREVRQSLIAVAGIRAICQRLAAVGEDLLGIKSVDEPSAYWAIDAVTSLERRLHAERIENTALRRQVQAAEAERDEARSALRAAGHTGKEWRTCERCSEVRSKAIARYESVLNSIAHGEGGDTQAHDWPEFWESVKRRALEALEP